MNNQSILMILNGMKYMSWIKDVKNELKEITFSRKRQKEFGLTFFLITFLLAIWFFYLDKSMIWVGVFILFSIFFLLSAFYLKKISKFFYFYWMLIAVSVGWFVTRFVLIIVFYLAVFTVGAIARLFGKKFIDNSERDTYWHKRNSQKSKESYFKTY